MVIREIALNHPEKSFFGGSLDVTLKFLKRRNN